MDTAPSQNYNSVVFDWNPSQFDKIEKSCKFSPETSYILKYMPRPGKILEAGCGSGRYVLYLSRLGFDITGIEINPKTVSDIKSARPGLDIRHGDITSIPFPVDTFGGVICLGVIEHFAHGPGKPLAEIFRVLKIGHYAVITVPSFNGLRRMKYSLGTSIMGRQKNRSHLPYGLSHRIHPEPFFEYLFTKKEFENELKKAGFTIIESAPIGLIDGVYHEISRYLAPFDMIKFNPRPLGIMLNSLLSAIPFFHNHMHLCVVKK